MGTMKVSLKDRYQRSIELAEAAALFICIVMFQSFKKLEYQPELVALRVEKITTIEIPQTVQEKMVPPPARPAIPIESESDDLPADITIHETELRLNEVPALPDPPVEEKSVSFPFIAYDEPPQPKGGFAAIKKNLVYPELDKLAGIEGTVVVYARISETGDVVDTRIVVPLGSSGCNDAAIAAIKSVRWIPARQREVPVAVWISIPIRFQLK